MWCACILLVHNKRLSRRTLVPLFGWGGRDIIGGHRKLKAVVSNASLQGHDRPVCRQGQGEGQAEDGTLAGEPDMVYEPGFRHSWSGAFATSLREVMNLTVRIQSQASTTVSAKVRQNAVPAPKKPTATELAAAIKASKVTKPAQAAKREKGVCSATASTLTPLHDSAAVMVQRCHFCLHCVLAGSLSWFRAF